MQDVMTFAPGQGSLPRYDRGGSTNLKDNPALIVSF